jgi:hypothetical protein
MTVFVNLVAIFQKRGVVDFRSNQLLYRLFALQKLFYNTTTFRIRAKIKKNPADLNCRVLLYPFNRIEGKGRGETGGRTYGET